MMVQEELARAGVAAPVVEPSEASELQARSCDELRAIAGRGIHGGDLYFAAVAELERRAHDTEVALEARHADAAVRRRQQAVWAAVLATAVAAAAIARYLGF